MPSLKLDLLVNRDPDEVWKEIGDFHSIAEWHPEVASCEAGTDENGKTLRTLTYSNGHKIVERLGRLDEASRSYTYGVAAGKLPAVGFLGQFMVYGNAGQSHIVWTAEFDVPPGFPEERAIGAIDGILQSAAPALKAKFG